MMYPAPSFVMYSMNATFTGMKGVGVPLREDYSFDADDFVRRMQAEKPALVFIAYPNNPTGVLYPEADVEKVIRAAPGLVVVDEAYHVFARKTFMPRLAEFPNLAVLRTVSKLGLAGIRLGYLAARPEWIREFNKVRQAYNLNVLTQAAALYVLERLDVLEEQAARILRDRGELARRACGDARDQGVPVRSQLLPRAGTGCGPHLRSAQTAKRPGAQSASGAAELPAHQRRHPRGKPYTGRGLARSAAEVP